MKGGTIGPYVLREPLGNGARGQVWRGSHAQTGIDVAIKHMRAPGGDGADRSTEARALASLGHPAIARIHDLGTHGGRPWIALELGRGTLGDRPPTSGTDARDVVLDLLAALAHAHARRVLHRDLKPSNVVWVDGRPKLVDFDIAVLASDEGPVKLSGTPLYLAPEQLSGDRHRLGPWTDLYALGWLAWELFAGVHPWAGRRSAALLDAQRFEAPPAWPDHLPAPLGDWIRTCLAKSPADRFRRAADAAAALAPLAVAGPRAVPLGRPLPSSATFTFSFDVEVAPRTSDPTENGTVSPAPMPPDWRPSRPWPPEPMPLAGLGLFALRRVPTVGREDERSRLWAELGAAHAGETRCVVLRGAPGSGRRHLARWLCERAHETGAASDLRIHAEPGVDPQISLRRGLVSTVPLWGIPRSCRAATFDVLRSLADPRGPRVSVGATWAALADWLIQLAGHRTRVLWLDDPSRSTDWLDGARRLLQHGAGRTLVLLTTSDDAAPSDPTHDLEVGPLPGPDAQALARVLLGLHELEVAGLAERTGGHPLFMVQLVTDWVERGALVRAAGGFRLADGVQPRFPAGLRQLWAHRLSTLGLTPEARQLLERVAIWLLGGGTGDDRMWAALGPEGVHLKGLVAPSGLLAESMVLEGLSDEAASHGRAAAHHARCAALLDDAEQERRGLHLLRAGDTDAARPLLRSAVGRAVRQGEVGNVTRLVETAPQWASPFLESLLRAKLAYLRGAYGVCRDRASAVAAEGPPDLRQDACRWTLQSLLILGPPAEAEAWGRRGRDLATSDLDRATAERLHAEALVLVGRVDEAEALVAPLLVHPDRHVRAAAWHSSGAVARARGDRGTAIDRYARAAEEHRANGDPYRAVLARMAVAGQLRRLGRCAEAAEGYAETIEAAVAIGSADADLGRLNLGWTLVGDDDRFPGAREPLEACLKGVLGTALEIHARLGLLAWAGRMGRTTGFDEALARIDALRGHDWFGYAADSFTGARDAWAHDPERAERIAQLAP